MECKRALEEAQGDMEAARKILRKRGMQLAAKKSQREARAGKVESYIHSAGNIGVLLEINCETDFVSRNEEFCKLARDVAMQIAAMQPEYIGKDDVPEEIRNKNKEDGDFFRQVCLLEQPFIKDQGLTIKEYISSVIAKTGENIVVRRFVRYKLGE
ncbi:MAG: elongation factor Ts [Candidatus Omnitrophota bacterium]